MNTLWTAPFTRPSFLPPTFKLRLGKHHDVSAFCSDEPSRKILRNAWFQDGKLKASDGRIGVWIPVPVEHNGSGFLPEEGALLPADALKKIKKDDEIVAKPGVFTNIGFGGQEVGMTIYCEPKETIRDCPNLDVVKHSGGYEKLATFDAERLIAICKHIVACRKASDQPQLLPDITLYRAKGDNDPSLTPMLFSGPMGAEYILMPLRTS